MEGLRRRICSSCKEGRTLLEALPVTYFLLENLPRQRRDGTALIAPSFRTELIPTSHSLHTSTLLPTFHPKPSINLVNQREQTNHSLITHFRSRCHSVWHQQVKDHRSERDNPSLRGFSCMVPKHCSMLSVRLHPLNLPRLAHNDTLKPLHLSKNKTSHKPF